MGGSLAYGGATGATNDTWELISVDGPLINEQPASQYRTPSETAIFGVTAVGPGTLTYRWYRESGNGPRTALPQAGEYLTIQPVRSQDASTYSVAVSNECGTTWSHSAILTLDPKLQIFSAANTTTLVWSPEPKLVLEIADEVQGPWAIVPNPPNPFNIAAFGPGKFFRLRRPN